MVMADYRIETSTGEQGMPVPGCQDPTYREKLAAAYKFDTDRRASSEWHCSIDFHALQVLLLQAVCVDWDPNFSHDFIA